MNAEKGKSFLGVMRLFRAELRVAAHRARIVARGARIILIATPFSATSQKHLRAMAVEKMMSVVLVTAFTSLSLKYLFPSPLLVRLCRVSVLIRS